MTVKELYDNIGGDYDKAIRILRMDRLLDKHIRRFAQGGVVDALLAAGETMDAQKIFETAHAVKGVCGNLALTGLYEVACVLSEEFRPGNPRKLSDAEVKEKLQEVARLYAITTEGIRSYEG